MTAIDSALARLARLHPKKIDLGLERVERVLAALGDPQLKLGRTVHVAGTNGKGSTVAFLKAMGEAAGLSVNVYSSPHLVRFNERIAVHGAPIEDAELIEVLNAVEEANGDAPLSFFEATTAAMFLAFARRPADLTLIEVGLGGRYDATNVIVPDVSVITPVDMDHAEFLGRDLGGIAREKAGIIKEDVPVVAGPQKPAAAAMIEGEAIKLSAPLAIWGQDYRAYQQHGRLVFEAEESLLDLPAPALYGDHQYRNAGTAIAAARALGLSEEAIAGGLRAVRWPARMQALTEGPYAEMVAESGGELWLDGGHNPHAARALASFMASREAKASRPLILVMGILANKDAGGFLDEFSGLAAGLIALSIEGHVSLAPETLAELAQNRGMVTSVARNITDGVQRAINMGEALSRQEVSEPIIPPRILICGSLYLAGEVLFQGGM
jgi:dihydrofolate synthase/folylpolyglutamate synthase